jgi:hypothetical protein
MAVLFNAAAWFVLFTTSPPSSVVGLFDFDAGASVYICPPGAGASMPNLVLEVMLFHVMPDNNRNLPISSSGPRTISIRAPRCDCLKLVGRAGVAPHTSTINDRLPAARGRAARSAAMRQWLDREARACDARPFYNQLMERGELEERLKPQWPLHSFGFCSA